MLHGTQMLVALAVMRKQIEILESNRQGASEAAFQALLDELDAAISELGTLRETVQGELNEE